MAKTPAKPRIRVQAGRGESLVPNVAYFHNESVPLMAGWNPMLRETQQDVQASWEKAAARATAQIQNSGFVAGIVEVASGGVVGSGLRMAARPDAEALKWDEEYERKWTANVEARFRAWATTPAECDAAGQMTFGQMQQAAFASYMNFGEILALMPLVKRGPGDSAFTKVALTPPMRLMNYTAKQDGWVQGVRVDRWGMPLAYRFREEDKLHGWKEVDVRARDADGRANVLLIKDPSIATTRGITPFAPVLKVTRQVDQYADATLTAALLQTIFAATLKTNMTGISAFEGLMTQGDTGALDLTAFLAAKGDFYDGAKIDLTKHGRIAQLFPNDELEFNKAEAPGQEYDQFMGWLLREIARGAGVSYEAATWDFRGATYSSVRMASALEWLTVLRRRENLIVPFCRAVYEAWLDEQVQRGLVDFPGGYVAYQMKRALTVRSTWTGPAKPQADDFKTARAYEVRKGMQATTLAEIAEEYGRDWDDDARQRAKENAFHDKLGLPRPWAPQDMIETPEGQELALKDPGNDSSGEKIDPKRKGTKKSGGGEKRQRGGGRNPAEREPADASLEAELHEGE